MINSWRVVDFKEFSGKKVGQFLSSLKIVGGEDVS